MKKKEPERLISFYSCALAFLLWSLSSEMVNLTPLPFGNEIHGFGPSPMTKMLVNLNKTENH
jgi:hypothetical protein